MQNLIKQTLFWFQCILMLTALAAVALAEPPVPQGQYGAPGGGYPGGAPGGGYSSVRPSSQYGAPGFGAGGGYAVCSSSYSHKHKEECSFIQTKYEKVSKTKQNILEHKLPQLNCHIVVTLRHGLHIFSCNINFDLLISTYQF